MNWSRISRFTLVAALALAATVPLAAHAETCGKLITRDVMWHKLGYQWGTARDSQFVYAKPSTSDTFYFWLTDAAALDPDYGFKSNFTVSDSAVAAALGMGGYSVPAQAVRDTVFFFTATIYTKSGNALTSQTGAGMKLQIPVMYTLGTGQALGGVTWSSSVTTNFAVNLAAANYGVQTIYTPRRFVVNGGNPPSSSAGPSPTITKSVFWRGTQLVRGIVSWGTGFAAGEKVGVRIAYVQQCPDEK